MDAAEVAHRFGDKNGRLMGLISPAVICAKIPRMGSYMDRLYLSKRRLSVGVRCDLEAWGVPPGSAQRFRGQHKSNIKERQANRPLGLARFWWVKERVVASIAR